MPHTLFNYPSWQSGSSPTGTPISYLPIGESSNLGSNPALPTRLQHNQVAIGSQSGAYNNDPGNNDFMPMQNGTLSNSSGYYGEILATNINSNPGDQLVSTFPTEGSSEGRTVQGQMHEGYIDVRQALRCRWDGCTYRRHFNREADLVRHVKTKHISPRCHKCAVKSCTKSFNREDNLRHHMARVHQRPLEY
ncbi:hypothetical protein EYZ11_013524 [Aspergillus tanneri]|uniref:C2H2-type domain-containing protein n=1 Tax=Aspergillus tanneri TaxID=1220188 RepID=A0A4S3IXF6_9EURO|nr:hypothetical protein EYZ11_013524 [Aspergillus tanneri]